MNDDAPRIVLTGRELGDFPDTYEGFGALSAAAEAVYASHFVGSSVFNKSIPADIKFRPSAKGKLTGTKQANRQKLKLIPAIAKLVATATVTKRDEPADKTIEPNIKMYLTLKAPLELEGNQVQARMIVKQDDKGHYLYDQSINKKTP